MRRWRSSGGAHTRTRTTCGTRAKRCVAPAAHHRAVAAQHQAAQLRLGEDGKAGVVGGQPLEDAGVAVQQAHDVALAQAHLVGERVDDLVVHERHLELGGEARGDVLAERAHFPGHGYDGHGIPPALFLMVSS